jgi:hypothetical protein
MIALCMVVSRRATAYQVVGVHAFVIVCVFVCVCVCVCLCCQDPRWKQRGRGRHLGCRSQSPRSWHGHWRLHSHPRWVFVGGLYLFSVWSGWPMRFPGPKRARVRGALCSPCVPTVFPLCCAPFCSPALCLPCACPVLALCCSCDLCLLKRSPLLRHLRPQAHTPAHRW